MLRPRRFITRNKKVKSEEIRVKSERGKKKVKSEEIRVKSERGKKKVKSEEIRVKNAEAFVSRLYLFNRRHAGDYFLNGLLKKT